MTAGDRDAFRTVFPDGLVFLPAEVGRRRVWRIRGTAKVGPTWVATPAGLFAKGQNWLSRALDLDMSPELTLTA